MTTHNQSFFVFHSRRVVLMASPSPPDPRKSSSSPFLCRYRCVHLYESSSLHMDRFRCTRVLDTSAHHMRIYYIHHIHPRQPASQPVLGSSFSDCYPSLHKNKGGASKRGAIEKETSIHPHTTRIVNKKCSSIQEDICEINAQSDEHPSSAVAATADEEADDGAPHN